MAQIIHSAFDVTRDVFFICAFSQCKAEIRMSFVWQYFLVAWRRRKKTPLICTLLRRILSVFFSVFVYFGPRKSEKIQAPAAWSCTSIEATFESAGNNYCRYGRFGGFLLLFFSIARDDDSSSGCLDAQQSVTTVARCWCRSRCSPSMRDKWALFVRSLGLTMCCVRSVVIDTLNTSLAHWQNRHVNKIGRGKKIAAASSIWHPKK